MTETMLVLISQITISMVVNPDHSHNDVDDDGHNSDSDNNNDNNNDNMWRQMMITAILAHCRSKLSLAQSAVHRCEAECSDLQDNNHTLSHQLARSASHLTIAHTRLRYTHMADPANTCQRLSCAGSSQSILNAVCWCTHCVNWFACKCCILTFGWYKHCIVTVMAAIKRHSKHTRGGSFQHHYMLHSSICKCRMVFPTSSFALQVADSTMLASKGSL